MKVTEKQFMALITAALPAVLAQGMVPDQPPEASDVATALDIVTDGIEDFMKEFGWYHHG